MSKHYYEAGDLCNDIAITAARLDALCGYIIGGSKDAQLVEVLAGELRASIAKMGLYADMAVRRFPSGSSPVRGTSPEAWRVPAARVSAGKGDGHGRR